MLRTKWALAAALLTVAAAQQPPSTPAADGVYRVGGGVQPPLLTSKKEPEYTEAARKAGLEGTITLYVEVGPTGSPQNMRVEHSLGMGLDEKALDAVRQWRFNPGTKDGRPVTVAASVQVNFRRLGPWKITGSRYSAPAGFSQPVLFAYRLPRVCKKGGLVAAAFDISADGVPGNIRVVQADHAADGDAAIALLREWRFQPARKNQETAAGTAELQLACAKR